MDWIKKEKITSTRSSFYKKEPRYADYIITSKSVDVKSMFVMEKVLVSDHVPLVIDIA